MTLHTTSTTLPSHARSTAPQANTGVQVVKAIYDAYARRDLEAVLALIHPDAAIYQSELLPWGGRYKGREGLKLFLGRLMGEIDTQFVEETVIEAGDRVVSIGRTRGRARASGQSFDLAAIHVYEIIDGQAHRCEAYIDTPGMLRALA